MIWDRGRDLKLAATVCVLTGCVPSPPPAPSPRTVQALETDHTRAPDDAGIGLALGKAYYRIGRYEAAARTLETVTRHDEESEEAELFLAATLDTLGRRHAARDRYQALLTRVGSETVRGAIRERLQVLAEHINTADAREATATGAWPGAGGVAIGVLPLRNSDTDTSLIGVGIGLAAHLAEEFVRAGFRDPGAIEFERFMVLARTDGLAADQLDDAATAARFGRILAADLVVSGAVTRVDSQTLRVELELVDIASGNPIATVAADTGALQISTAGSRLVRELIEASGGPPPDARVTFAQRAPRVEALAAYGRGVRARVAGDPAAAVRAFRTASLYEPNWSAAREAHELSRLLLRAPRVDPWRLAHWVEGPTRQAAVRHRLESSTLLLAPPAGGFLHVLAGEVPEVLRRKPVAEATGSVGPERAVLTSVPVLIRLHLWGWP